MSETEAPLNDAAELAAIWAKRAKIVAQPPPPDPTGEEIQILTFEINNKGYGIETRYIQGAYHLQQLTPVPRTPNFFVGLFNRRGHLIPVIDLYAFWGMAPIPITANSHVVVATQQQDGFDIGLLVDSVTGIITVFRTDLDPPLTTQPEAVSRSMLGIWQTAVLLDLNLLLADQRLLIHEDL
ncbi:MAG: chemotaxis protein CheW [Chloroflexota bacterium]